MRVAVAGKGGSGKTTVAATLSRLLSRRGRRVLAIDADSNPNLAVALGLGPEEPPTLPGDLLRVESDALGNRRSVLALPVGEVVERYGIDAPDGVRLLVVSRIDHAGTG